MYQHSSTLILTSIHMHQPSLLFLGLLLNPSPTAGGFNFGPHFKHAAPSSSFSRWPGGGDMLVRVDCPILGNSQRHWAAGRSLVARLQTDGGMGWRNGCEGLFLKTFNYNKRH